MAKRYPKPVQQLSSAQFEAMFPMRIIAGLIWSPAAGRMASIAPAAALKVTELTGNAVAVAVLDCGKPTSYRFSHIAGTIFENTNKPFRDWFKVAHLMLTAKRELVPAVGRFMGFGSVKTAWLMSNKIRTALIRKTWINWAGLSRSTRLSSAVRGRTCTSKRGNWAKAQHRKTAIIGAVERKGNVVTRVICRPVCGRYAEIRARNGFEQS